MIVGLIIFVLVGIPLLLLLHGWGDKEMPKDFPCD